MSDSGKSVRWWKNKLTLMVASNYQYCGDPSWYEVLNEAGDPLPAATEQPKRHYACGCWMWEPAPERCPAHNASRGQPAATPAAGAEEPRMMPLEDVARIVARLTAELAEAKQQLERTVGEAFYITQTEFTKIAEAIGMFASSPPSIVFERVPKFLAEAKRERDAHQKGSERWMVEYSKACNERDAARAEVERLKGNP